MLIIGDVHCKIKKYHEIIKSYDGPTLQVGDFGLREENEWHMQNVDPNLHKINFGNHDDYNFLNEKHSCDNWSYWNNVFTIRGANSVDKHRSVEGIDWFPNEELNYQESNEVIDNYTRIKPQIVVSHDCPALVNDKVFGYPMTGINAGVFKNSTGSLLQALFEIHQPALWLFGHKHKSKDEKINGTRFICLAELETFDILKNKFGYLK